MASGWDLDAYLTRRPRGRPARGPIRARTSLATLTALGAVALFGSVASGRGGATPAPDAASLPDFVRDVQPILAASCVRCHGPAVRKGLLRLHARKDLLEGGESGEVVVPGDPASSLLYQKLLSQNPKARMPQEAEALPPGEIETHPPLDRGRRAVAGRRDGGRGRGAARPGSRRAPRREAPRSESSQLQPGRAADPRRELLRLPRAGPEPPRGGASPRPRGCGEGGARLRRRRRGRRRSREERAPRPRPRPRRVAPHAAREERETAARSAAGGRAAPLDRGRGRVGTALGLRPALAPGASGDPRRAVAARPRGRVRALGPRGCGPPPLARGRAGRAAAPPELRPHRPPAHAGGGPGLRGRPASRRLRAPGGQAAGVAALRRADGRLLAGPRALRRQRRLPQRQRAADVALPRLGRLRLQPQPALRPVHRRTAGRRPASRRLLRAEDRLGLQPAAANDRGGRRAAEGVPGHLPG